MARSKGSTPPPDWRGAVLSYLTDHPHRTHKTRGLARALDVPEGDYAAFRELVREMLDKGELVLGARRSLQTPAEAGALIGTFRATDRGFGFVSVAGVPDFYVPRTLTRGARDGDTVAAKAGKPNPRTGEPRAAVTRIIERAPLRWVGVLEKAGSTIVVRPSQPRDAQTVHIEDPTAKGCQIGDLVVVEPLEHTLHQRVVRGVILERLGDAAEAQSIILAAIRRFDIPDDFPAEVRNEAQQATTRFADETFAERTDLRELLTITIDPPDARDFDDAITIELIEGGRTRLGVHIADVAHFVPPGSALDDEARQRGNSVYFPKYVVPMLPEALSNGVCSLQPGVPRLAKSVFITYDRQGRVERSEFANSVIVSDARLTYDQVTAALEGDGGDVVDERVAKLLRQAEQLARTIQKRRIKDGMIVLALPEVELTLDKDGKVVDAGPADTSFSHTIIEMFMVEANEAVCRLMVRLNVPHLRRVHPEPDPAAAKNLVKLRPLLGRDLPDELNRETMRMMLDAFRGKPEEMAVSYILLRSMAQAQYSPSDQGHFALASQHYCHFTSPIRRYPDLTIHRLLDAHVRGELDEDAIDDEEALAELGMLTSNTERRAQQAEREVKTSLLLMLMQDKIGETFDGLVTGALSFGVFVQVQPHMAEGLVRAADFGPDAWEYDERASCFVGVHSGRQVFLGQRVRVVVDKVDLLRQELDLVPEDPENFGVVRKTRGGGKSKQKHAKSDRKQQRRARRRR